MLDFPANSAGDFFRLLPFEGYVGVLSFFPVRWLRAAAQVSKGWHFVAQSRAAEYDASVTCNRVDDLTNFVLSLSHLKLVSAIRCDISRVVCEWRREDFQRCSVEIRSRFTDLDRQRISHVTWKCGCLYFVQYHVWFLRDIFPKLKSFKLHVPSRKDPDTLHVNSCLNWLTDVMRVSVVAERVRKRGYKTSISWSGDDFPRRMRSLHLEGLCFSMPGGPELDVDIFESFLSKAVNVVAIYLDMDSEWWETWGCKFELGILDWIKSRPRMIRFDMKTLNNSLQAQIQALLLDQRRRRIRRSRR